jgi:hypothetical protein
MCQGTDLNSDPNKYHKIISNMIIYIFTVDSKLKKELISNLFSSDSNMPGSPPAYEYNLSSSDDDNESDTDEELTNNNDVPIELFKDNDFRTLLKICLSKPDLINVVSSYLISGNIIEEIKEIELDEFTFNEEYNIINNLLTELNIIKDELEVKQIINHFNGHINLSVRYILAN